ncbi:uncharacterized protein HMPREF1541_04360 [Cyphellophora europaea CBS 101466]|uniref:Uncharacterized protein n=1 Tax=Cyphellophora europaea (strain CBS 101466) TaxID=1220924 RepID=W2RUV4_CYPE1|nr:uncharacterized protein HMPREF1541_04360 [Cyphellophora europaea CBS 101466]ETN40085.1 hypothetical protein HMPREF1541_04360 [Cyphellophora europaea CBS 101466]
MKLLEEGPYAQTSLGTREQLKKTLQDGYNNLLKEFDEAKEKSMIAFHHMHPHFMLYPMLASSYVHGDDSAVQQSNLEYWHVKTPRRKDESYTSSVVLPDEALLQAGTHPIFTIRHPGVMVPSIWRTMREVEVL